MERMTIQNKITTNSTAAEVEQIRGDLEKIDAIIREIRYDMSLLGPQPGRNGRPVQSALLKAKAEMAAQRRELWKTDSWTSRQLIPNPPSSDSMYSPLVVCALMTV